MALHIISVRRGVNVWEREFAGHLTSNSGVERDAALGVAHGKSNVMKSFKHVQNSFFIIDTVCALRDMYLTWQ